MGQPDYSEVATKEKLSELQLRVRQLLDQVEQITKEQNYQRVQCSACWLCCSYDMSCFRHERKGLGKSVIAQTPVSCGGPLVRPSS